MPNVKKYIESRQLCKTKKQSALDAGYSESMSNTPSAIEDTDKYHELMRRLIPDDILVKKHKELLYNKKPEVNLKALDMAYKVKGYYNNEGTQVTVNVLNNYLKDRGV